MSRVAALPPRRAHAAALVASLALALAAVGCFDWRFSACDADLQTDRAHCGACGNACALDRVCAAGQCVCPRGGVVCAGQCVDAQSDATNCGACGNACGVTAPACSAGRCVAVRELAAGGDTTCAVLADGTARCWGSNMNGQLGALTTASLETVPRTVLGAGDAPLREARAVAVGGSYACAVTADGAVYCWGDNRVGQCGAGAGSPERIARATRVVDTDGAPLTAVARIAAGAVHACATTTDGALYCWGDNSARQFGTATVASPSAAAARLAPSGVRDVAAGLGFTCAVQTETEAVYCFGANNRAQLGRGAASDAPGMAAPVQWTMDGAAHAPIAFLHAGVYHACAGVARPPGLPALYCWGDNAARGVNVDSGDALVTAPVAVTAARSPINASDVALGLYDTCAWTGVFAGCWGLSTDGQLGGTPTGSSPLVPQLGRRGFTMGSRHTCAIATETSLVTCWGSNMLGQLGDRNNPPTMLASRNAPQPVKW